MLIRMKRILPVLRVTVSDLRQGPQRYEVEYTPEQLDLKDESFTFWGPVRAELEFDLVMHEVYMKGSVCCEVTTECVRCLGEARFKLESHLKVMYEKNPDLLTDEAQFLGAEDGGVAYYDGEFVVPDAQLREALLLELPDMPHCSEGCRGLCVRCGANLNTENCGCSSETSAAVCIEDVPETPAVSESWKEALRNLKLNERQKG